MSKRTNLDSSNPDYKPENDPLAQIPRRFDRSFLSSAWRLAKPYLMESEERWKARGLLLATVVITLLLVVINLQITNWFNRFYNALQGYDQAGFWKLLGEFTLLAFAAIALSVYQTYLSQLFDLRWRKWLTGDYLRRYLSAQTYYHMEVFKRGQDNPDQRIADDLSQFSQLTTSLFTGMLSAIANLVAFIGLLWVLSAKVVIPWSGGEHHVPGFLVWVALIYAVAWTWVAAKIGNPLIWLNFNQQRLQADFRFSLMRLRENSEAVAFYRGEAMERDHFDRRFDRVYHNYKRLILRQKRFNWFSSYFSQVAVILPFLATASAYFAKAVPLGFLMQVSSAFGNVQGSFAYLAQSYDSFAQWHAVVDRLRGFVGLVDEVERIKDHENRIEQQDGQELLVDDLRVLLPGGGVLHEGLNLKVATGEHLLITGPSGAGKSTLLRALAGIWPFGEGRVIRPQGERSLFLPQRPYLPMGTLRDAILYPGVKGQVDDESIQVLLEAIDLPRLYGYLDEVEPWSQVLSLGEQQRLAIGRALLQRPDCLFMDESTSALDEPSEAELYRLLFEHLPQTAIISVGHRSTLRQLHERALVLAGSRDEVEQTNVVEQEI